MILTLSDARQNHVGLSDWQPKINRKAVRAEPDPESPYAVMPTVALPRSHPFRPLADAHPQWHRRARARGKLRGKQPKRTTKQQAHLLQLHGAGDQTIADLVELFSVSRATVYRVPGRARATHA
ncbi:hypothetical protein Aca07nite_64010 [Actinoplanes capillaceus]|uniref:Resolvase HTH domain-containing protein n=1 Tax=Actinoplanes campanulatus TaxID=113559 RepID=A0ABQ3WS71_9ACTN|nr:helix-turn-helix domain-containing protein [Actinoplanes capillaceus]GID49126.1 hypothetical protein Aca07nite_64010 [Actinoplanes capillaceus]